MAEPASDVGKSTVGTEGVHRAMSHSKNTNKSSLSKDHEGGTDLK